MTTDPTPDKPVPGDPRFKPVDFYLEMLLTAFLGRSAEAHASVTLFVGGAVVSGTVIPHKAWVPRWLDQLAAGGAPMTDEIRASFMGNVTREEAEDEAADAEDRPSPALRFVHMRDATVYAGGEKFVVPLWRGRFEQIDGWSLGTFQAQD